MWKPVVLFQPPQYGTIVRRAIHILRALLVPGDHHRYADLTTTVRTLNRTRVPE